jgi:hypothetical protein
MDVQSNRKADQPPDAKAQGARGTLATEYLSLIE